MFLDLAATSSSLIVDSFAFLRFLDHLDKLYICKGDDPFSSVHVYLLISSTALPYFHRKKGEQFTTVTYLSVLSTLNKSNIH